MISNEKKGDKVYLNISNQQSEEHQTGENNTYTEDQFQPLTCGFQIIAKSAVYKNIVCWLLFKNILESETLFQC